MPWKVPWVVTYTTLIGISLTTSIFAKPSLPFLSLTCWFITTKPQYFTCERKTTPNKVRIRRWLPISCNSNIIQISLSIPHSFVFFYLIYEAGRFSLCKFVLGGIAMSSEHWLAECSSRHYHISYWRTTYSNWNLKRPIKVEDGKRYPLLFSLFFKKCCFKILSFRNAEKYLKEMPKTYGFSGNGSAITNR